MTPQQATIINKLKSLIDGKQDEYDSINCLMRGETQDIRASLTNRRNIVAEEIKNLKYRLEQAYTFANQSYQDQLVIKLISSHNYQGGSQVLMATTTGPDGFTRYMQLERTRYSYFLIWTNNRDAIGNMEHPDCRLCRGSDMAQLYSKLVVDHDIQLDRIPLYEWTEYMPERF